MDKHKTSYNIHTITLMVCNALLKPPLNQVILCPCQEVALAFMSVSSRRGCLVPTYNYLYMPRGVVNSYTVVRDPDVVFELLHKHLFVPVDLLDEDLLARAAVFPHPVDREMAVGRAAYDVRQRLHLLRGQGWLADGGEVRLGLVLGQGEVGISGKRWRFRRVDLCRRSLDC